MGVGVGVGRWEVCGREEVVWGGRGEDGRGISVGVGVGFLFVLFCVYVSFLFDEFPLFCLCPSLFHLSFELLAFCFQIPVKTKLNTQNFLFNKHIPTPSHRHRHYFIFHCL